MYLLIYFDKIFLFKRLRKYFQNEQQHQISVLLLFVPEFKLRKQYIFNTSCCHAGNVTFKIHCGNININNYGYRLIFIIERWSIFYLLICLARFLNSKTKIVMKWYKKENRKTNFLELNVSTHVKWRPFSKRPWSDIKFLWKTPLIRKKLRYIFHKWADFFSFFELN